MDSAIYIDKATNFRAKEQQLKLQSGWLSTLRLIVFLIFLFLIFQCTQTAGTITIAATIASFAAFLFLIKWHGRLQQQKLFYAALSDFNEKEASFLQTNKSVYDIGKEYENPQHPFSYDLDFFAEGGLFSYLNRCSTSQGKTVLAQNLLQPNVSEIKQRQEAIKELAGKIDFRQQLYAHGSLHKTKNKDLDKLIHWVDGDAKLIARRLYYLLMIFPLFTICTLMYYIFSENEIAFSLFSKLFVINLVIAFCFAGKITSQLSVSTSVTKILRNYSNQLQLIENGVFQSALLLQFQQQLKNNNQPASKLISRLASLFNYLETIINLLVSILLNGILLFHVHILYRLGKWKQNHAEQVKQWLNLIGQFEALSSLANLSYNNLEFCFPEISSKPALKAINLGHLLVKPQQRVCNNVSFNQQKFVILTGSNMSGKSTFLRTLGINLALAKTGSVVCADAFEFYPFDIFVSMRITDSLQDSESLFYAELKRLQSIIKNLESGSQSFVILDEILRGTNSNDKRNGTIGLIRKMAGFNTFGIIATHDLAVAELIKEYPDFISNKAFESAIINDELFFDYKLKNGVCNTLSASFLMKKMDII